MSGGAAPAVTVADTRGERVVRVVLVPSPPELGPLDYRLPAALGAAAPGSRVLVPLGRRRAMGVVVGDGGAEPAATELRDVIAVLDAEPVLDRALLELVDWMAEYYLANRGEAYSTALPGALRVDTERIAALTGQPADAASPRLPLDREIVAALADGPRSVAQLVRRLGAGVPAALRRLERQGAVAASERLRREVAPTRRVRFFAAAARAADDPRLARRAALREIYAYLREHPLGRAPAHELRHSFANASGKLRELVAAGLVRQFEEEEYRVVLPPPSRASDRAVTLTPAQREAVDAIAGGLAAGFVPWLLWGVTGSGKTEVYLRAIAEVLAAGRSALVLVPEISLTHQLVERVQARFGATAALLHSGLGAGERWDEWRRLARGEARIAVGARSAVFAPLRDLGIVVVDEEHDPAYKQADGVRYHGRDVAVMRAKLNGCALVLGSATPSLESYVNARRGRYRLLELGERVAARPLPPVTLVDLRSAGNGRQLDPLTPELAAALTANLAAGGQSLLFLNRRGFANFLQCRACGDPVMCPNCSVALTLHRKWRAVRCHYCEHTIAVPRSCAGCGESALAEWGVGTEQLEMLLRQRFPGARVARLDRDTTRRKGSQAALLRAWRERGYDILVGTQMIAKGHDVAGVTLVGVVHADASLNFPDFRAAERTFQLLAQVAGRAGRGEREGRVLVQTLQPYHESLQAAAQHDYARFASAELEGRRELDYPPFGRLVLLRVEGPDHAAVERLARNAASALRERAGGAFGVLGPAPAPLERLRQLHRWQILLRGQSGAQVRRAVAERLPSLRAEARQAGARVIADVDPQGMQ